MANRLKTEDKEPKKVRKSAFSRTINAMLSGEFLTRAGVVKHMPFILFVALLFLAQIGIGYYFENVLREQDRVKREIEELTSRYNTVMSDLESEKQQSSVVKSIDELGLKEPQSQPNIIEVESGYFEE
ncbi:MAG: hypothetical protein KDC12_01875 [Flavobacteriales bacterium]|nr:hypothetical protein [Flavobacteriales bacterium]